MLHINCIWSYNVLDIKHEHRSRNLGKPFIFIFAQKSNPIPDEGERWSSGRVHANEPSVESPSLFLFRI